MENKNKNKAKHCTALYRFLALPVPRGRRAGVGAQDLKRLPSHDQC